MNNDGNKPGDKTDKHNDGDKRSDRTGEKLSKDSPEANAKSYRAALTANPNKTDTLSPDGKSKFALTDNGKPLTNSDQVKILDELKKASDQGQMLAAGGKLQQPPIEPLQRAAEVSVPQAEAITQQPPPEIQVQQQIQQSMETPVQQKDSSSPDIAVANLFSKGHLYPDGVPPIPGTKVLQGKVQYDEPMPELKAVISTEKVSLQEPVKQATEHQQIAHRSEHPSKKEDNIQNTEQAKQKPQEKKLEHSEHSNHTESVKETHHKPEELQAHKGSEIHITKGIQNLQDAKDVGVGIAKGLGSVANETLKYLATPNSVRDSLLSIGPALDTSFSYYSHVSPKQLIRDAGEFAEANKNLLVEKLGHPMSQQQIGESAGAMMPAFFAPIGKSQTLTEKEMEALGGVKKLEQMSPEELKELGLERKASEAHRGDNNPYSAINQDGGRKSHINMEGDLCPANPKGTYDGKDVTVGHHLDGRWNKRAKANSPFTSFTVEQGDAVTKFGNAKITVNLDALREAIAKGEVKGVEILEKPDILSKIDQSPFPEVAKAKHRARALRHDEVLVKGKIPKQFLTIKE